MKKVAVILFALFLAIGSVYSSERISVTRGF